MTFLSRSTGGGPLSSPELIIWGFFATLFTAALIAAFQPQFLPFFEPLLVHGGRIWRIVYYGFWGSAALLALLLAIKFPRVRARAAPTGLVCLYALVLTALHPLDPVAKNFVVAMVLVACLTAFITLLPSQQIARFSASVTALMAVLALLDILFRYGFTTTGGRAAGLSLNPNVAAAGLLLGAVATYQAVPERWRFAFLSLVVTALAGTLSRSTMLIVVMAVGVVILSDVLERRLSWRPRLPKPRKLILNGLLLVFFAGWLGVAATLNDFFAFSIRSSFRGLETAVSAVVAAEKKLGLKFPDLTTIFQSSTKTETSTPDSVPSYRPDLAKDQQKEALEAVDADGEVNSAGTRALLFKRSLLAFLSGPFFGVGLQQAHDYHPHNTYLLFAVAFGWPGLLLPVGFLALTALRIERLADVAFGLTVAGLLFFSHDILLAPGLLVPLVVGIAARARPSGQDGSVQAPLSAFRFVTILTTILFAAGAAMVAIGQSGSTNVRLDAEKIFPADHKIYYAPVKPLQFGGFLRTVDTTSESGDQFRLYENGHLTAPAPLSRPQKRLADGQYYQYRRNQIVFAATDRSDPRENRRSYSVDYTVGVHPLMYLTLIAIVGWCVGVFFLFGGRSPRGKG